MNLFSADAERSVIGSCLLQNNLIDRVTDILTHRDFASLQNAIIWRAMVEVRNSGKAVDVVTVADVLDEQGSADDVGGIVYLAEVARNTPSAANALSYAGIVADLATRRRMLDEISTIEKLTYDKKQPLVTLIDEAQGRLSRLIREDADAAGPIGNDLKDMVDEITKKWDGEKSAMGLSFGLKDLDSRTMGMHPGQLIIVGGRPAQGKTAFALNILRACCVRDEKPALIFSMEMDRKALRDRMTAAVGDMPLNAIRNPKEHMTDELFPKLGLAVNSLKEAPLIIDDRAGMTPSQIRGAAKRWRDHYGELGVVMVDYLQLVRADGRHGSREQEVSEMSRSMKLLAKELQCPVVALSQLNRSLENRTDKRPMMSDLRESGSLEQDADLILFLYREESYKPDQERTKGIAEVIIGKQREGATGTVYAAAILAKARFENLDHEAIDRLRAERDAPPPKKQKSAMANF